MSAMVTGDFRGRCPRGGDVNVRSRVAITVERVPVERHPKCMRHELPGAAHRGERAAECAHFSQSYQRPPTTTLIDAAPCTTEKQSQLTARTTPPTPPKGG